MPLDKLTSTLIESHPAKAARVLARFPLAEQSEFLHEASSEQGALLISHLSLALSIKLVSHLASEKRTHLLSIMLPSDAANIVRGMPADISLNVLSALPKPVLRAIKTRLEYPSNKIGSLADTNVITLPMDISVYDANKLAKRSPHNVDNQIFILDKDRNLVGYVHLKDLWHTDRKVSLNSIIHFDVPILSANMPISKVITHSAWKELEVLPVKDKSGQFIGVIHDKDLRTQMEYLLSEKGVDPDKDILSTVVAFSELFWNVGAELLTETSTAKTISRKKADD